jgi:hypothetical protein
MSSNTSCIRRQADHLSANGFGPNLARLFPIEQLADEATQPCFRQNPTQQHLRSVARGRMTAARYPLSIIFTKCRA